MENGEDVGLCVTEVADWSRPSPEKSGTSMAGSTACVAGVIGPELSGAESEESHADLSLPGVHDLIEKWSTFRRGGTSSKGICTIACSGQ